MYNSLNIIRKTRNVQNVKVKILSKEGGVKVVIKNNGMGDAEDVFVELHVEGGIFGMINKTVNDTVDIIAGEKETVSTGILLGFGPIEVTATVGMDEQTKKGLQLSILSIV